jgi:hypothetical protein
MFNVDDRVEHKATGEVGKVIGYGHQIARNDYLTTIKVQIFKETSAKLIVEDLLSNWFSSKEKINR